MITQKIIARTDSLKLDKIISRYGEDSMRQVVFIIVRPEPDSEEFIPITIPEDAVGSFRILKPSGNFVIVPMSKSILATGETAFDVVLPASANTAKGSGYYDIRITSDTDKYYFTAQGDFLIDDNIISDDVLEDVSEANGLIFPDDFMTETDLTNYATKDYVDNAISTIDLTDYATKDYVNTAISEAGGKVIYSSTPQETGEYNGKKVYTVLLSNFTVRSFSGTEYNSQINNMPIASKILSLRILCNYVGYSSVSYPVDTFYDNLNNVLQVRGMISPSFGSITLDAAIVEYVEI